MTAPLPWNELTEGTRNRRSVSDPTTPFSRSRLHRRTSTRHPTGSRSSRHPLGTVHRGRMGSYVAGVFGWVVGDRGPPRVMLPSFPRPTPQSEGSSSSGQEGQPELVWGTGGPRVEEDGCPSTTRSFLNPTDHSGKIRHLLSLSPTKIRWHELSLFSAF